MLLDIEHKLDLIQQIHREQAGNELQGTWFASFHLRLLLAMLLFLCFFVMEKKKIEIYGISYTEIVEYIDSNIDISELSALMDL